MFDQIITTKTSYRASQVKQLEREVEKYLEVRS